MKIIVLTGKFGMGHYSAANSLKEQLEKEYESSNIKIVDILEYLIPKTSKVIYSGFNCLVKKASGLYNFLYKNSSKFDEGGLFTNVFVNKVNKLIEENEPEIIISTLPLSSAIISKYKEKTRSNIPLVTCITDISTNNEWISSNTDLYLVATEEVKKDLIKKGVEEKKIRISGIPVKAKFMEERLEKNRKEKHLLVMGGGLGLIPLNHSFYERLSKEENIKVTVITGKNKKEYNKLAGKYKNVNVIGYTDKVHEYMEEADLIISKAGGITLFEIIHKELPLLVLKPFLEQEKFNAQFIESRGIGKVIWDKNENIANEVMELISDNDRLNKMKNNMISIKNSIDKNMIENIMIDLGVSYVA